MPFIIDSNLISRPTHYYKPVFGIDVPWYQLTTIAHLVATE